MSKTVKPVGVARKKPHRNYDPALDPPEET